ncbi:hypothetical protein SNOUR_10195 [Streptomyces noursei ATCC 11455]|nr:hypothetical protein SNOUR_10195 [Streptomyces noursei ATCC 11455]
MPGAALTAGSLWEVIGVSMRPGVTALIRIRRSSTALSKASVRTKLRTLALLAAYSAPAGRPLASAAEPVTTTAPPGGCSLVPDVHCLPGSLQPPGYFCLEGPLFEPLGRRQPQLLPLQTPLHLSPVSSISVG